MPSRAKIFMKPLAQFTSELSCLYTSNTYSPLSRNWHRKINRRTTVNTLLGGFCYFRIMIQLYSGLENLQTMEWREMINSSQTATDVLITISSIPAAGMRRSPHFSHFRTNPGGLLFKLYQKSFTISLSQHNTPIHST